MKLSRSTTQAAQTVFLLVLATVIGYLWKQHVYFLYTAVLLSIGGWLMGQIIPKVLLSIIFYLVLTPLALLSKLIGEKDPMQIRKPTSSLFKEATPLVSKESFKKMW